MILLDHMKWWWVHKFKWQPKWNMPMILLELDFQYILASLSFDRPHITPLFLSFTSATLVSETVLTNHCTLLLWTCHVSYQTNKWHLPHNLWYRLLYSYYRYVFLFLFNKNIIIKFINYKLILCDINILKFIFSILKY